MSRTYRRRRGDPTWKEWHRNPWSSYSRYTPEQFAARYHSDGHRNMTTPSWWVRQMMTRPQRQEVRRLTTQVLRLVDLEDAPVFPHPKKPHLYYW